MLAIRLWSALLLIFIAPCFFAEDCLIEITTVEGKIIEEMFGTLGYFCSVPVKILNKETVENECDRWALVFEVDGLLEKLNFTRGKVNDIKKNKLIQSYSSCLENEDYDVKVAVNEYLQIVNMNPVEILQRVNDSLNKISGFTAESGSSANCISFYSQHGQNNKEVHKGSQCTCSSPTMPLPSSETSQTSKSPLSEFARNTYTSSYSLQTSPLVEDMSGSYPEKLKSPQKNTQGLDSQSVIFTDAPSDLTPLTTIVDYSFAGDVVQSGDKEDYPLAFTDPDLSMHSTGFPKDTHRPSYVSLYPSSARTDPVQATKVMSNSGTEGIYKSLVPPTIESSSRLSNSHINGDFSTVMETDEIQETTKSEISSQSSTGSVFQDSDSIPSKEPSIETSSSSVTKIRRSLVNMDSTPKSDVTTQSVSSLSTSANDLDLFFLKSVHTDLPSSAIGLSDTEALETVSVGNVVEDRNLGWASSYLSSLTIKTELPVSSPWPGDQLPLSDVTNNPVLKFHKSYNILPQQERDIASDDRQKSVSGPIFGSNMLPIIATEKSEDRPKKEHNQSNLQLLIVVPLVVLVLLFLCGFLYYRYQYRKLRRRLTMSCDQDLTTNPHADPSEERMHLQIECDVV